MRVGIWYSQANSALNGTVHPTLGFHPDFTRDVIERRPWRQWKLALGWIRNVLVEVVSVTTGVRDVLQLSPEGRVEREYVLVGLSSSC